MSHFASSIWLDLLAYVTCLTEGSDVAPHMWPVEPSSQPEVETGSSSCMGGLAHGVVGIFQQLLDLGLGYAELFYPIGISEE